MIYILTFRIDRSTRTTSADSSVAAWAATVPTVHSSIPTPQRFAFLACSLGVFPTDFHSDEKDEWYVRVFVIPYYIIISNESDTQRSCAREQRRWQTDWPVGTIRNRLPLGNDVYLARAFARSHVYRAPDGGTKRDEWKE